METQYLIPEKALVDKLPEHLQKRFIKALTLMLNSIEDGNALDWKSISEQCAISHYHFLRQFEALFHQTPGKYLARIRLQYAAEILMADSKMSVTDVAFQVGFSTSQAFAKALKRELNLTAKELVSLSENGTLKEISSVVSKLAHPVGSSSLEAILAKELTFSIVHKPLRKIYGKSVISPNWDTYLEKPPRYGVGLTTVTQASELEKSVDNIQAYVGRESRIGIQKPLILREGNYLALKVWVASDAAYLAALNALTKHAEQINSFSGESYLVETLVDVTHECACFEFEWGI